MTNYLLAKSNNQLKMDSGNSGVLISIGYVIVWLHFLLTATTSFALNIIEKEANQILKVHYI